MWSQIYAFSFITIAIALNEEVRGPPLNMLIKSDHNPKPNPNDGISEFDVHSTAYCESYKVDVDFKPPMNIYHKTIEGYSFKLYQFKNATHLNLVPYNEQQILKDQTHFAIYNLQYNRAYYAIMYVLYDGEELNYAYAGTKHFKYGGDHVTGNFIKSDNYRFAPVLAYAKVNKNLDESYNIAIRWHGIRDRCYKSYIKGFRIEITRIDSIDYTFVEEIAYIDHKFEHTFTSVPRYAEYQVSIFAIPIRHTDKMKRNDFASSRTFFDLH